MELVLYKQHTVNSRFVCKGATSVDWLGRKFMAITEYALEQAVLATRPLTPGRFGQNPNLSRELARRVLRVIVVISLLWSIVPFLIGGAFYNLARVFKRDMAFIKPIEHPQTPHSDTLTVTTFNVGLLPDLGSHFNRIPCGTDRIDQIARALLTRSDDVVCLQEAFCTEHVDTLVERLKRDYPYILYGAGPQGIGVDSGLLIASKRPLRNPKFTPFRINLAEERLAKKGILSVEVKVNAVGWMHLVNTHLQADFTPTTQYSDGAVDARLQQLTRLRGHCTALQRQAPNLGTLVVGDFNIPQGKGRDWRMLSEHFELGHIPHEGEEASTFWVEEDMWSDKHLHHWRRIPGRRIDHIGFPKSSLPAFRILSRTIDHMDGSSDHLALRAQLTTKLEPIR